MLSVPARLHYFMRAHALGMAREFVTSKSTAHLTSLWNIGMRMLDPRELFNAQVFPKTRDLRASGSSLTNEWAWLPFSKSRAGQLLWHSVFCRIWQRRLSGANLRRILAVRPIKHNHESEAKHDPSKPKNQVTELHVNFWKALRRKEKKPKGRPRLATHLLCRGGVIRAFTGGPNNLRVRAHQPLCQKAASPSCARSNREPNV